MRENKLPITLPKLKMNNAEIARKRYSTFLGKLTSE